MTVRLFIVAAIVLIVFALCAFAGTGTLFGVAGLVWLCAALLAFFTDLLVGGWGYPLPARRVPPAA